MNDKPRVGIITGHRWPFIQHMIRLKKDKYRMSRKNLEMVSGDC